MASLQLGPPAPPTVPGGGPGTQAGTRSPPAAFGALLLVPETDKPTLQDRAGFQVQVSARQAGMNLLFQGHTV